MFQEKTERYRQIHIVHEWLTEWGGSEDAIRVMLDCYPDARLFATIDYLSDANRAKLGNRDIKTTVLATRAFRGQTLLELPAHHAPGG
jgi:hypothetical protein